MPFLVDVNVWGTTVGGSEKGSDRNGGGGRRHVKGKSELVNHLFLQESFD
jgi:hypothetical protein